MPQSSENNQTLIYEIKHASGNDVAQIAYIHSVCFAKGWPAKDFAGFFKKPKIYKGLIALADDNQPIGFVCVSRQADEAEILTLCVIPERRHEGVAKKLMTQMMADLAKENLQYLFLEVSQENETAIKLYQSLGFEKVGVRSCYSHVEGGKRSDAFVMKFSL